MAHFTIASLNTILSIAGIKITAQVVFCIFLCSYLWNEHLQSIYFVTGTVLSVKTLEIQWQQNSKDACFSRAYIPVWKEKEKHRSKP